MLLIEWLHFIFGAFRLSLAVLLSAELERRVADLLAAGVIAHYVVDGRGALLLFELGDLMLTWRILPLFERLENDVVDKLLGRQHFLAEHAKECDIAEDAIVDEVLRVLPGDFVFEVVLSLLALEVVLFRYFDEDELLQLVDVAQVHRHLQDFVVEEIWSLAPLIYFHWLAPFLL